MSKLKLGVYIDLAVKHLLIFFCCFIWIRFVVRNILLTILLSFLFATIISVLLSFIFKRRENQRDLKMEEKKKSAQFATEFVFMKPKSVLNFFSETLKEKFNVEEKSDYLLVKNLTSEFVVAPIFVAEKVALKHILLFTKKINCKKLIVLADEFEPALFNQIKKLNSVNITLYNKNDVFKKILQRYNSYPEITLNHKTSEKLNFTSFLNFALNKRKTKSYFIYGLFLLLFASVTGYNIYYSIVAFIMFMLSIVCHFNHGFNKPGEEVF